MQDQGKDIRTRTQDSRLGKVDNRSSVEGPEDTAVGTTSGERGSGEASFQR